MRIDLYVHHEPDGATSDKLDQLLALVRKGLAHMDQELTDLETQAKANTDAEASAVIVLNGIAAAVAKAIAAAQSAGATTAQLARITALQTSLASSATPLAAAVVAGTAAEA